MRQKSYQNRDNKHHNTQQTLQFSKRIQSYVDQLIINHIKPQQQNKFDWYNYNNSLKYQEFDEKSKQSHNLKININGMNFNNHQNIIINNHQNIIINNHQNNIINNHQNNIINNHHHDKHNIINKNNGNVMKEQMMKNNINSSVIKSNISQKTNKNIFKYQQNQQNQQNKNQLHYHNDTRLKQKKLISNKKLRVSEQSDNNNQTPNQYLDNQIYKNKLIISNQKPQRYGSRVKENNDAPTENLLPMLVPRQNKFNLERSQAEFLSLLYPYEKPQTLLMKMMSFYQEEDFFRNSYGQYLSDKTNMRKEVRMKTRVELGKMNISNNYGNAYDDLQYCGMQSGLLSVMNYQHPTSLTNQSYILSSPNVKRYNFNQQQQLFSQQFHGPIDQIREYNDSDEFRSNRLKTTQSIRKLNKLESQYSIKDQLQSDESISKQSIFQNSIYQDFRNKLIHDEESKSPYVPRVYQTSDLRQSKNYFKRLKEQCLASLGQKIIEAHIKSTEVQINNINFYTRQYAVPQILEMIHERQKKTMDRQQKSSNPKSPPSNVQSDIINSDQSNKKNFVSSIQKIVSINQIKQIEGQSQQDFVKQQMQQQHDQFNVDKNNKNQKVSEQQHQQYPCANFMPSVYKVYIPSNSRGQSFQTDYQPDLKLFEYISKQDYERIIRDINHLIQKVLLYHRHHSFLKKKKNPLFSVWNVVLFLMIMVSIVLLEVHFNFSKSIISHQLSSLLLILCFFIIGFSLILILSNAFNNYTKNIKRSSMIKQICEQINKYFDYLNCNQQRNSLKWVLGKDFFWIEIHLFNREQYCHQKINQIHKNKNSRREENYQIRY